MKRMGDHTIADLAQLGKPLKPGEAPQCRYCDSSLLVYRPCHVGHGHIMCGDCKATSPAVKKGPNSRRLALEAWRLRAPSLDLASHLASQYIRTELMKTAYRETRKTPDTDPCSFCGSNLVQTVEDGVINYRIYVICNRCEATGPWAVGKPDARLLWNQAFKEEKKWVSGFRLKPVANASASS